MAEGNAPTDKPNEDLLDAAMGIAARMSAATKQLNDLPGEYQSRLSRAFAKIGYGFEWVFLELIFTIVDGCSVYASTIRAIREGFDEYAIIHQQLTWNWDTMTEDQLDSLANLDGHLTTIDKEIDKLHQIWALARYIVMDFEAGSPAQILIRDAGRSVRDDLRRMHEVVTQIRNTI